MAEDTLDIDFTDPQPRPRREALTAASARELVAVEAALASGPHALTV
jgi:hypothetical protein